MAAAYVDERLVEDFTSDALVRFFKNLGFELIKIPIPQLTEKHLPADFLYFDKNLQKLFGFQYKALYHNGKDYWKLTKHQHDSLQSYPWIFYLLSELREGTEYLEADQFARIVGANRQYSPKLPFSGKGSPFYFRWAAFYRRLQSCKSGIRIKSEVHLRFLLNPTGAKAVKKLEQIAADVFLANFSSGKLLFASNRHEPNPDFVPE